MSFSIEFTPQAETDLNELYEYVVIHDSQSRATELVSRIEELVFQLMDLPERGTHPRELHAAMAARYRQVVYKQYRVVYRIASQRVEILMVADGRRDFGELLKTRLRTME